MLRPETRVLLGTGGTTDLESTSWLALVYSAPVGLGSGKGIDLGALADIGFNHAPKIEPVPNINYQEETQYDVTGEELTVTVTIKEWRIQVLQHAIATGRLRVHDIEAQITFGGGCAIAYYPLVIEFSNVSCNAPSSQNIGSGITGGILTLYKTMQVGGLPWDAITAKELNPIKLTFKAVADTTRAKLNRLGNLYLY
jgi:hypothetical protein